MTAPVTQADLKPEDRHARLKAWVDYEGTSAFLLIHKLRHAFMAGWTVRHLDTRASTEALEARVKVLEEALEEARGGIQAFSDMVNIIQKWQALPIPAILETAQHNCPVILEHIDAILTEQETPNGE